jgi:S-methylmethionine-dependent homocysteine/selenocysteine methylase
MSDVTILDGGMGKELRRVGAPFRQPEWSSLALMEAPEMVVEAHTNFIEAGARVITTNNYAVVPYHHTAEFFAERGAELCALAGQLARAAADASEHRVLVAGSMPPLFGSYEPRRFDAELASPIYLEIARALEPYVDLWVGETLSTIAEMDTIIDALDAIESTKPVWMAFSLPDSWGDHGIAVRSGETVPDIARAAAHHAGRVEALLFNCSLPEQTGPALAELSAAIADIGLDVRLGGYANAFPTAREYAYAANEVIFERREELTGERYAEFVADWIASGASIVGGCCDMYPEHIAALANRFG